MKTTPKKKRKVTELYFNEYDGTAEIYTYNTKLKKRLTAYAATYPDLCQLTEDDKNGGLRFEIDKHRISIRLTAPYSEERKAAASQAAIKCFPPIIIQRIVPTTSRIHPRVFFSGSLLQTIIKPTTGITNKTRSAKAKHPVDPSSLLCPFLIVLLYAVYCKNSYRAYSIASPDNCLLLPANTELSHMARAGNSTLRRNAV